MRIALAGNPNSGKTTLFNALTGLSQSVGNWPGVTVEEKNGLVKGEREVVLQDLPGIYSLSPYSLEEKVTRRYLVEQRPDGIVNIVDGTNIERNLYLSTQLAELGIPMVMAVNMMDVVRRNGDRIDFARIGKALGCSAVGICALKGDGVGAVSERAVEMARKGEPAKAPNVFTGSVAHAIEQIEASIRERVGNRAAVRWHAVKVFERDEEVVTALGLSAETHARIERHIAACEAEFGEDAESIITGQRYEFIKTLMDKALARDEKRRGKASLSDKIDRIVTNRFLAIPVFVVSLCAMWWLAVAGNGPGTLLTDWANDGFLGGDGWFLPFSRHEVAGIDYETACEEFAKAEATVSAWEAGERSAFLEDEETGEKSDEWEIDAAAYAAAKEAEKPDPSAYGVWIPGVGALLASALERAGVGETVASLVNDGAWGGVATVLGFVPVIAIVFLFLAFLEDCGYMARVAFIMDRLFRRFGLSGKSFIPMIVGKGCGVPAIMAARTIENERDRRMTIVLATFIPCGAKTVIIAMFSALFFRAQWYVAALMDVIGIAIIVLGGIALKKSKAFAGEAAPFVMELPAYHLPTLKGVAIHAWERVKAYMLKAGLIIFPACVILWFVMHFDWSLNLLADEEIERSILHDLGSWIAWLFAPLGFGTWQGAAAAVSAEIAKEQATATLSLVSSSFGGATSGSNITALFGSMSDTPRLAAFSFMCFNLFIPPCMVAVATTFREMVEAKWGWFAVGFQLLVGYVLSLSIYQIGRLAVAGTWGFWTVIAALADLAVAWMVFRPAAHVAEGR